MVITVIGESCKDIFIYGDTNRLSPEVPVPVLSKKNVIENMGMSGNVVSNLDSMLPGQTIYLITQRTQLKKTRFVDEKTNHMFLRMDEGEESIDSFQFDNITEELIKNSDLVVVSDYNKGYLSDIDLIKIGNSSKLSILDSKRKLNQDIFSSFDFIKLNQTEYKNNFDICNKYSQKLLQTLGMDGCKYMDTIYPVPQKVFTMDVSGAGDTFTSAFILKYKETNDVVESIKFANLMACKVVLKRGVKTPFD